MICSDAEFVMPLYLSGELDASTMAQLERHTAECAACRRLLEEQQALDAGVRTALLTEHVDDTGVRAHVLSEIHGDRRRIGLRIGMFSAIAAALLVSITLGFAYRDDARYRQASADHVAEVVEQRRGVWRTQDGNLEQFVTQRVSTAANLQQLEIPGYHLLRGKECRIAKTPYVHLVYGNGKQQISMYVLSGDQGMALRRIATSLLPLVRSRSEAGYNVTEGDASGRRIMLVSTLPQTEEQVIVKNMLQTMS
jgi:anti-sigma factor RsiW